MFYYGVMTVNPLEVLPEALWATRTGAELAEVLCRPGGARLCLATGRTVRPVYAETVRVLREGRRSAARSTIVLLDEYLGLAPGDPARCDEQIREAIVDPLVDPPSLVTVDVDGGVPEDAVAALDAAAGNLDLAVVGLGRNGHVGMNEPGSTRTSGTRVVDLEATTLETATAAYGAQSPPTGGITVGLDRLLEAHEVWLLVNDPAKRAVLEAVVTGPMTPQVPASLLRQHPRLRIIVTQETVGGRVDR